MKQIKRILLTGDDGYNSIGTRLLVHFLKDRYDLTIVGTKIQQSAVGGLINVREGCSFQETKLDGVPTLVVDGAPADAMEFAHGYFESPFDLVISGINLGENVSNAVVSSGTVCAAVRSLVLHLAPRAIAISWSTPPDYYFKKHDEQESLFTYLAHPGEAAEKIIAKCVEAEFFGARMLNINLPRSKPKGAVFARPSDSVDECYLPVKIDRMNMRFSYPFEEVDRGTKDLSKDVEAMAAGYVTLTPMNADWTDEERFETLAKRKINWG